MEEQEENINRLYAEYYQDNNIICRHELNSIQSFNDDIEKTKEQMPKQFKVILVKEQREELSTRLYNRK